MYPLHTAKIRPDRTRVGRGSASTEALERLLGVLLLPSHQSWAGVCRNRACNPKRTRRHKSYLEAQARVLYYPLDRRPDIFSFLLLLRVSNDSSVIQSGWNSWDARLVRLSISPWVSCLERLATVSELISVQDSLPPDNDTQLPLKPLQRCTAYTPRAGSGVIPTNNTHQRTLYHLFTERVLITTSQTRGGLGSDVQHNTYFLHVSAGRRCSFILSTCLVLCSSILCGLITNFFTWLGFSSSILYGLITNFFTWLVLSSSILCGLITNFFTWLNFCFTLGFFDLLIICLTFLFTFTLRFADYVSNAWSVILRCYWLTIIPSSILILRIISRVLSIFLIFTFYILILRSVNQFLFWILVTIFLASFIYTFSFCNLSLSWIVIFLYWFITSFFTW